MADYSGDIDPWEVHFTPDTWYRKYWGSSKNFSIGWSTWVPREMPGLLVDGLKDFARRNKTRPGIHRIEWDPQRKMYFIRAVIHLDNEKTERWLLDNGFEHIVRKNELKFTPEPTLF